MTVTNTVGRKTASGGSRKLRLKKKQHDRNQMWNKEEIPSPDQEEERKAFMRGMLQR